MAVNQNLVSLVLLTSLTSLLGLCRSALLPMIMSQCHHVTGGMRRHVLITKQSSPMHRLQHTAPRAAGPGDTA